MQEPQPGDGLWLSPHLPECKLHALAFARYPSHSSVHGSADLSAMYLCVSFLLEGGKHLLKTQLLFASPSLTLLLNRTGILFEFCRALVRRLCSGFFTAVVLQVGAFLDGQAQATLPNASLGILHLCGSCVHDLA